MKKRGTLAALALASGPLPSPNPVPGGPTLVKENGTSEREDRIDKNMDILLKVFKGYLEEERERSDSQNEKGTHHDDRPHSREATKA